MVTELAIEKLLAQNRFFSIHIASNRLTARCFYSGFFFYRAYVPGQINGGKWQKAGGSF
jgi:hypothetical protein